MKIVAEKGPIQYLSYPTSRPTDGARLIAAAAALSATSGRQRRYYGHNLDLAGEQAGRIRTWRATPKIRTARRPSV